MKILYIFVSMNIQDKYINHLINFFEFACFNEKNMSDQFYIIKYKLKSIIYLRSESFDFSKKKLAIKKLSEILDSNNVIYTIVNEFDINIDVKSLFNINWHSLDLYKSISTIKKFNL